MRRQLIIGGLASLVMVLLLGTPVLAQVDLNGDGKVDAVFTKTGVQQANPYSQVCFGDGAGGFSSCSDVKGGITDEIATNALTTAAALGDWDGDGDVDIFFSMRSRSPIPSGVGMTASNALCVNDGTGAFPQCATMGTGKISEDVALGDLNGDGTLDAVLANSGLPTLSQKNFVVLGAGGLGAVGVEPFGPTQNRSSGVALGDVDQDGDLDVVFANSEALNTVCINDGNTPGQAGQPNEPTFTCSDISLSPAAALPAWSAQNTTNDVALTDLNGDGVLDAIFANTGVNETCTGNGTGTFTCTTINVLTSRPSLNVTVGQLGSFSFSRNDRLDFVFANDALEPNTRCLAWFTAGQFHCTDVDFDNNTSPRVGNNSSTGVAVGDLDGDGDGEMVFSNWLSENRVCNFSNVHGGTTCADASTGIDRFSGVAVSDGRSFQEDFNGTVITNLEDAENAYTVSGGKIKNTASTGLADRRYVRTHVTDYNTVDFVAELTFTLTNDSGEMLHYFGVGPGIPDATFFDEPATGAYFRIHSPNTVDGRVDASFRDLEFAGSDGKSDIGRMTNDGGTHRARLAKSGNELTFSMDVNFDGSVFDADFTYTVDDLTGENAAPFLDNTNSRIFFGTASRIDTFDDFKVTAVVVADTTAPVVTVPSDITEEATSPSGAVVTFSASATDDVDGSLTPSCTPSSGSTFALDVTTEVKCEATDSSNNTGESFFDVTVEDTTSPQFTSVPVDFEVGTTFENPFQALVQFQVSATDAVGATVTCVPSSGTLFDIGVTQVDCTASDAAGNLPAETSFNVTVNGFGDQVDALTELDAFDALPANIQRGLDNFLAYISRIGDSNPNSGIAVSGMLGSFQNQVRALVRSRRLSPENGDALISATETVRTNLDPRIN